jgi:colanic acid biosynthesis glycosyl transferase WcaI
LKILLYSINFLPELTGIGKYNGEMVEEFLKNGLNLDVVTTPPYYPEWKINPLYKNTWSKTSTVNLTLLRNPIYVPSRTSTLKRLLHLSSFALSSIPSLIRLCRSKPDFIILVQPTLFCAPATLLFSKLTGAKSIMHIQDFEIDAMLGLGMSNGSFISKIAKSIEKTLISRFDYVSSISLSMLDNAKHKGVKEDKLLFFPNWADTDFVTPQTSGDELKAEWGFNTSDKVILYSGNIGEKQGLEIVLGAASHFASQKNIKFVLVGAGAYATKLKEIADKTQLKNVFFKDLLPWAKVPQMLALADIHLVIQKKGAADAVLPSKLTNILSAGGHALVTAESNTELGKLANKFDGIFQCAEPENLLSFTQELSSMLAKDLKQPNAIARLYAEEYLAKDKILDKFVEDLRKLTDKTNYKLSQREQY